MQRLATIERHVARSRPSRFSCAIALGLALTCALLVSGAKAEPPVGREDHTEALTRQLTGLSSKVDHREARQLARVATLRALHLKQEYRAGGSPQFHNFLVNTGLKRRGLCHHWARDLGTQLARLKLRTLTLRWGIARAGTLREHNAVVVSTRGQPFERGIVLDAWRHSGRLFAGPVAGDKYPWKEDKSESFAPIARR